MSKNQPEQLISKLYKKNWGEEEWIVNKDLYCLKILRFKVNKKFSMHYHIKKEETWYVMKGKLLLEYFDLSTATRIFQTIVVGDIIDIKPCIPHKLTALENSEIIEVSTTHYESDSYRIEPGDSQQQQQQNNIN